LQRAQPEQHAVEAVLVAQAGRVLRVALDEAERVLADERVETRVQHRRLVARVDRDEPSLELVEPELGRDARLGDGGRRDLLERAEHGARRRGELLVAAPREEVRPQRDAELAVRVDEVQRAHLLAQPREHVGAEVRLDRQQPVVLCDQLGVVHGRGRRPGWCTGPTRFVFVRNLHAGPPGPALGHRREAATYTLRKPCSAVGTSGRRAPRAPRESTAGPDVLRSHA
jgi:hypothetical protein